VLKYKLGKILTANKAHKTICTSDKVKDGLFMCINLGNSQCGFFDNLVSFNIRSSENTCSNVADATKPQAVIYA